MNDPQYFVAGMIFGWLVLMGAYAISGAEIYPAHTGPGCIGPEPKNACHTQTFKGTTSGSFAVTVCNGGGVGR